MTAPRLGVQLYTLRDVTDDVAWLVQTVRHLGYDAVEPAGLGCCTPAEVRAAAEVCGALIPSIHVRWDALLADEAAAVATVAELGATYLVVPWVPPEVRRNSEDWRRLGAWLNTLGARCWDAGLRLVYHNHAFEFEPLPEGGTGMDILVAETDPVLVGFELDLYWAAYAGEDVPGWIRRLAGRLPLVHLKDMTADDERFFAEVGQGVLPWDVWLPLITETGVMWWMVEQDVCRRPPMEAIRMSLDYLRKYNRKEGT